MEVLSMKECLSCKETMSTCIQTETFSYSHLYQHEKTMDLHIHDCYEIYYSISGGKQFLIDGIRYDIQAGDIFFINQYESHHVILMDEKLHERIIIAVHPNYISNLSSKQTNLEFCFHLQNNHTSHKIHLSHDEQIRFLYYIHKLRTNDGFGSDLLDKVTFLELMIFLNQLYKEHKQIKKRSHHLKIDAILTYINQNIQEPLTIESIAQHFYLSSSYLCRIFKAATGTTINKYITAKRITISKSLLLEGYLVNEACEMCGFNDYSNYLKAFRKAVGISPKKYAQMHS